MDSDLYRKYQLAKEKADLEKNTQNSSKITHTQNRNTFFHSNAYATFQNGNNIGSSSYISFEQRQKLDKKREYIQKYNQNSNLIQSAHTAVRPKTISQKLSK